LISETGLGTALPLIARSRSGSAQPFG